ncbi:imidazole glycerol phosphate synthase subunit HisH [Plesiomonas shigelloides]|uniref:imidazole glycerol phosphate synthase subunit HisH n=1 Tax=Plesiomonas shigelloides TaxID=703 RepID=UPI001E5CE0E5|nr:imidazole glycerol phosphate synthase subunit HisH [Plesiomonas shigelloides]
MTIKIIDYGMGNCGSIKNMLRHLGVDSHIVCEPDEMIDASAIILPGVGSYDHGVKHIAPFKTILEKKVLHEGTPFLGICLGMQLLLERSEEGKRAGLGWIKGEVKRFDFASLRSDEEKLVVPHMGWNEVVPMGSSKLMYPMDQNLNDRFYFVHSYHAIKVPEENQMALCSYGYNFVCAIQDKNIYGVQFHPEKSHKFGKHFFKQFIELSKC